MKRLFTLFTGLCVMLLAGCNDEYDDSALVKRLDDFEQRLERLERLCNDMNTNLGSMQTIVTADRKSTRLNSSHKVQSRMPSSA